MVYLECGVPGRWGPLKVEVPGKSGYLEGEVPGGVSIGRERYPEDWDIWRVGSLEGGVSGRVRYLEG